MSDEIDELTRVKAIIDGLSSPTDREFVYATDQFSAQAIGSAAAMIAKEGGGGPGELPDWWTVDSTPGAESVEFAGAVEIVMDYDSPALVVRANPGLGQNTLPFQFYDEEGNLAVDIDSQGIMDTRQVIAQNPPNTGASGEGTINFRPGVLTITQGATPIVGGFPLRIDKWESGAAAFKQVLSVAQNFTDGILQMAPALTEPSVEIVAPSAGSGEALRLWEFGYNNQLLTVGYAGWIDMFEQAEPAAPAANTGRLFVKDTGGKSQLLVRFPSGASQVIATEP